LAGLSVGLASVLLIFIWVQDELSMDSFHVQDDRLFQVMENHVDDGNIRTMESTSGLLGESLKQDFPEVEYAAMVTPSEWFESFTLSTDEKIIKTTGQFVGQDFFKLFSYPLIAGDKEAVLKDPNSLVISEDVANRLFGSPDNALGKTVEWQLLKFMQPSIVTGVFKDLPDNSSDQFKFVLSFEKFKEINPSVTHWGNTGPHTFLLLHEGTDIGTFESKIEQYLLEKDPSITYRTLFTRKFSSGYLYDHYENGIQSGGRIIYVKLFSAIAGFILLIACINFMNLSTAKASRRMKEVGIKKVVGARRSILIWQYLLESIFLAWLSLIVGVALASLILPQFNEITNKHLEMNFSFPLAFSFLAISTAAGLVAGSYPALYLSKFSPGGILKGNLSTSFGELWARKGLVVFQFVTSAILITSVLIVYKQIDLIQSQHLGFEKNRVISIPVEGAVAKNPESFVQQIKRLEGVANASYMNQSFIGNDSYTIGLTWDGKNPEVSIPFQNFTVGYDMIPTMGMEVLEGRNFSRDFVSDSTAIILNEASVKLMELTDPIGATVNLWGTDRTVIGVVRDFQFNSLHEPQKPVFLKLIDGLSMNILIKLEKNADESTLGDLGEFYQEINPGYTFEYSFLDDQYQQLYQSEQRVAQLSSYFASLAIILSCLGLFGLAAFTTERRMKEIGIRKILGSGNLSIIYMLSSEYTTMVITAILIATPISYFAANQWLNGFTLRIDLEWWYFVLAGMAALIIALTTVGFQTIKAARINPVDCLQRD
jgi:ABC-type antimicrobial peptide transport system permease subunit